MPKKIKDNGGDVICTGLGVSPFHKNLSEKAEAFLNRNHKDFVAAVQSELGDTPTAILDVSIDESIEAVAKWMYDKNIRLNGLLHAIAMDKTIRQKEVKPLIEVTKAEVLRSHGCVGLFAHPFVSLYAQI